jgi:predicted HAD superfamily Cof-like phosphohydrolase
MADLRWQLAKQLVEVAASHWPDNAKGAAMRPMVKLLNQRLAMLTADIYDFHERFRLLYDGPPKTLEGDLLDFRVKFMQEELDEYAEAAAEGDLEKQLDAIIDLVYVALGTLLAQGLLPAFAPGWNRVQAANMAKVRTERVEDSKRGSTFDVTKPEGWKPPTHADLIEQLFRDKDVEPQLITKPKDQGSLFE